MRKDLNRQSISKYFTKEYIQVTNKHNKDINFIGQQRNENTSTTYLNG